MPAYKPELYSMTDNQTLSSGYGDSNIMDLFNKQQEQAPTDDFTRKEIIGQSSQAAQRSGAAGDGLGGMLTSGGMQAGLMGAGPVGWGIAGGGLLLSAIEKNKSEKAAREQARIDAEMDKRNKLITLAREAAQNEFRLA